MFGIPGADVDEGGGGCVSVYIEGVACVRGIRADGDGRGGGDIYIEGEVVVAIVLVLLNSGRLA